MKFQDFTNVGHQLRLNFVHFFKLDKIFIRVSWIKTFYCSNPHISIVLNALMAVHFLRFCKKFRQDDFIEITSWKNSTWISNYESCTIVCQLRLLIEPYTFRRFNKYATLVIIILLWVKKVRESVLELGDFNFKKVIVIFSDIKCSKNVWTAQIWI